MEKLKQTGKIIKIGDKQMFNSGSGKISFRLHCEHEYSKTWEFELFKGADYIEHLDNFIKYNKIGDFVDVEFDIKTNNPDREKNPKDFVFTSLGAWKVSKVEVITPTNTEVKEERLPF